jgi:hypothetical protein
MESTTVPSTSDEVGSGNSAQQRYFLIVPTFEVPALVWGIGISGWENRAESL